MRPPGLKGVQSAVVRIVAEGSFVDPEYGEISNAAGSGSGFIIDPSGIAVTNNHVVTGAAFLQVYVDGEEEPRNAKIVGVSECSDLAVIDIDGAAFPYLEWWDGDIVTGTDIYVAGFPLGDPEYTLTEGIISKEKANGENYWASVDSVLEHTARAMGGNSGGPLVTEAGKVIGIHYKSWQDRDIRYAISRDEASKILHDLTAGNDVTSIGVNGEAFANEDLSGIWVSAVESGSPAANVGIKGGDIITRMEGIQLATDGTMADYCDILRSHDAEDPLAIEVLRFNTDEVLEGTLNSDKELTLAFSFADEFTDDDGTDATPAYEYVEIWDDTGQLVMQVPATWNDIESTQWAVDDEGDLGPALIASTDITGLYENWNTAGVWFSASSILAEQYGRGEFLARFDESGSCTYRGQYDYSDPLYAGAYEIWDDCGGTTTDIINLEVWPEDEAYLIIVQAQVMTDADYEALDVILDTFQVVIE